MPVTLLRKIPVLPADKYSYRLSGDPWGLRVETTARGGTTVAPRSLGALACGLLISALATGCQTVRNVRGGPGSPVDAGMNTNNIIDPVAQAEAEGVVN